MAGLGVSQNQDIEYQYVVILTGKMMINQRMELFFMFFSQNFQTNPPPIGSYWHIMGYIP